MDKTTAKDLIEDVFSNQFDKNKFVNFTKTLLYSAHFDSYTIKGNQISDQYKEHVGSLERLATYTDSDGLKIDLLVVTLLKDTALERARTMQRNFVASYLRAGAKDVALVAFVCPGHPYWRFSLIKMELNFVGINIKESFTPAKRWSFLVGENEGTHTAQSQLVNILVNDSETPTLEDLEQSFSVEKVTDEFFEKYTDLYHRMQEVLDELLASDEILESEFKDKEIDTSDFAKKTMGQISFLYFLQKKGWFGVAPGKEWGTGVKNFLRKVFDRRLKYGDNFFNDVLEPLFYEALAQDRGNESIYPKLNNCRMPFLNGGLFEPMNGYSWETTNILLPDELFSNNNETKEGDTGDGILDIFDRYNFTVNEFEPLDQEVAVDPEMLGKVFENLLEIKNRKSKGAFYTPREIVQYMCQETLINYLETATNNLIPKTDIKLFIQQGSQITPNDKSFLGQGAEEGELLLPKTCIKLAKKLDDLLADIKVCDPAVGSGAFPIGMLNEIISARTLLGIHLKTNPSVYNLKLHAISNSLYGVDLDPGAVEIAKLRFWLSLVVEEDNPSPLPNLEYKIMQGNSLLSQYEGIELFDDDFLNSADSINDEKNEIQEKLRGIEKKVSVLQKSGEFDATKRIEIEKEAKRLTRRLKFIREKINKVPETGSLFEEPQVKLLLQEKTTLLQSKIAQYISVDSRTNKENLKLEIDNLKWDLIEATLERNGEESKLDEIKNLRRQRIKPFFVLRLECGEVFKSKGGFDLVIANPPYIQLQKRKREGSPIKYGDSYENLGFETFKRTGDIYALFFEKGINLLKSKGHLTYITSNKWMRASYGDVLRRFFVKFNPKILLDFGGYKVFESATVDVNIIILDKENNQNKVLAASLDSSFNKGDSISNFFEKNKVEINNLNSDIWLIASKSEINLKQKIEGIGTALKDWELRINYGVKTGYNKAFIIDEAKRKELILKDPKSLEIIKPLLRGKDIEAYSHKFKKIYLINSHNGYIDEDSNEIPAIFIDDYPAIKSHLDMYWSKILIRYDKGLTPYNLRNCAYYLDFHNEKIMYSEIVRKPQFFYDENGNFFPEATSFIMTGVHLKLLTGILHSTLFTYIFSKFYSGGGLGGKGYRYKKTFFENTPVPLIDSSNNHLKEQIEELTKLRIVKTQSEESSVEIDNQIDRLVYELYELTDEEIKIIENSSK